MAAAVLALVACGGPAEQGRVAARIDAATVPGSVDRVRITVDPANVSTEISRDDSGGFSTELVVPIGEQTVTAAAFAADKQVGSGSGTVTVLRDVESALEIRILDSTGSPAVPDHGPYVTRLDVPQGASFGSSVALVATAIDPDGDEVSYRWSTLCGGTMVGASTSSATWTPDAPGVCTIGLEVASNALVERRAVTVIVYP